MVSSAVYHDKLHALQRLVSEFSMHSDLHGVWDVLRIMLSACRSSIKATSRFYSGQEPMGVTGMCGHALGLPGEGILGFYSGHGPMGVTGMCGHALGLPVEAIVSFSSGHEPAGVSGMNRH